MSIRITELECGTETGPAQYSAQLSEALTPSAREPRIFKVEGALHLKDAELLEKICRQVSHELGRAVIIELDNVCFVDSDSAAVLCRMKRENVVKIQGLTLFTRKVMELADESECSDPLKCS